MFSFRKRVALPQPSETLPKGSNLSSGMRKVVPVESEAPSERLLTRARNFNGT